MDIKRNEDIPLSDSNPQSNSRVLRGTLNMLIMRVVRDSPTHGYGIMKQIEAESGDVLKLEEGSLYPALHRLEKEGLLTSEWRQSESNRRAKFYHLTQTGSTALTAEIANWDIVSAAVNRVVQA
ncbi:lineage-specific thermal regulator protein [Rosistilla ulvae]|uniref:Lineage-specific thermal regulator protein n=1 Tax=Rosistilla ulvae TaxID=1930277 RepID=A0A517M7G9_9BACT|nr:lineage-specific thermal regulator protein [Rosistilla ulvae]